MTVWIALHLPRLPLEAQAGAAAGADPVAVLDGRALLHVNAAAAQSGVVPGMGVPSARGRCANLQILPRDRKAEQSQLDLHVHAALRYTPRVVLDDHTVALEVGASLRLFGGTQALWSRLADDVQATGLTVWMAAAPTLQAALLFARLSQRLRLAPERALRTRSIRTLQRWLDALPADAVAALWGLSEEQRALLQGLGIAQLGDLHALPREGLIRRGLDGLLHRWDQARGLTPETWQAVTVPEVFDLRCELSFATDALEALRLPLSAVLQALQGWTTARQRSVEQVSLFLVHDSPLRQRHPDTLLVQRWLVPERDPARWERGLTERLARAVLPAPVRTVRLRLDVHHAAPASTVELEGVGGAPSGHAETLRSRRARLIEDLTGRLGVDRVRHLRLHADHRPERASALVDPRTALERLPAQEGQPAAPTLPMRPAWLLPQPQGLEERSGVLWWGKQRLDVVGRPERIESGWFDGELQCRDYHWARAPDHRWAWIYRQRGVLAGEAPAADAGAGTWFLQGWFA